MNIFRRRDDRDPEEILEDIRIEFAMEELRTKQAERKLLEKRYKQMYGSNWKQMLKKISISPKSKEENMNVLGGKNSMNQMLGRKYD